MLSVIFKEYSSLIKNLQVPILQSEYFPSYYRPVFQSLHTYESQQCWFVLIIHLDFQESEMKPKKKKEIGKLQ